MKLAMDRIDVGNSLEDAFRKAAIHIANGLEPNQKLSNVMIPCVGRPDLGHKFLSILKETPGIDIVGPSMVYNEGFAGSLVLGVWGHVGCMYRIVDDS